MSFTNQSINTGHILSTMDIIYNSLLENKQLLGEIKKENNVKRNILTKLSSLLSNLSIKTDLIETNSTLASKTAKNGYREEEWVARDINTITLLKTQFERFTGHSSGTFIRINDGSKTDVTTKTNKIDRIQVKKCKAGQFQQVCRHSIDYLLTKIPNLRPIEKQLRGQCELPVIGGMCDKTKKVVKLSLDNYTNAELSNVLDILTKNKYEILKYALLGYDESTEPNILCGAEYVNGERTRLIFYKMIDVIAYLMTLEFYITKKQTVISLGGVLTLQRKGGERGKKAANNSQVKIIISRIVTGMHLRSKKKILDNSELIYDFGAS